MGKERIYSLDIIKIIATICLICHHYQIYTGTKFSYGLNFVGDGFKFTYLVELFAVLSGFFMFSYVEKIQEGMSFKEFFVPKYLRFLLPQMLSVVVFAVLDVIYEHLCMEQFFDRTVQLWGVIVAALGFSCGWGLENPKMNGTIWYISVLLLCYVIMYVIVFLSKKLGNAPYWLFAFMIFLAFNHKLNIPFIDSQTSRGVYAFFWGLILAKFFKGKRIKHREAILAGFFFGISLFVLLLFRNDYASSGINFLYTFILYPLLLIFMLSDIVKKCFGNKLWGIIGAISFEAYIWHFPCILALIDIDAKWKLSLDYSNRLYMFIIIICSYFIGALCYYFIEKPFVKYVKNNIDTYSEIKIP